MSDDFVVSTVTANGWALSGAGTWGIAQSPPVQPTAPDLYLGRIVCAMLTFSLTDSLAINHFEYFTNDQMALFWMVDILLEILLKEPIIKLLSQLG